MAKIDFTFIQRERPVSREFEFTDPKLPAPMRVSLRPLDDLEMFAAKEAADERYRRHVTGGWQHPLTGGIEKDPDPYPDIDGRKVTLTWERIFTLCRIEAMQDEADVADRYGFEDLVQCALKAPQAFRALEERSEDVQGTGWEGKAS